MGILVHVHGKRCLLKEACGSSEFREEYHHQSCILSGRFRERALLATNRILDFEFQRAQTPQTSLTWIHEEGTHSGDSNADNLEM